MTVRKRPQNRHNRILQADSADVMRVAANYMANQAPLTQRSPERIAPLLDLLKDLWFANPDLRLGQLISVLSVRDKGSADTFYIEDDQLRDRLELANEHGIAALFNPEVPDDSR